MVVITGRKRAISLRRNVENGSVWMSEDKGPAALSAPPPHPALLGVCFAFSGTSTTMGSGGWFCSYSQSQRMRWLRLAERRQPGGLFIWPNPAAPEAMLGRKHRDTQCQPIVGLQLKAFWAYFNPAADSDRRGQEVPPSPPALHSKSPSALNTQA